MRKELGIALVFILLMPSLSIFGSLHASSNEAPVVLKASPKNNYYFSHPITPKSATVPFEMKILIDDRYSDLSANNFSILLNELSKYGFTVLTKNDFSTYTSSNITDYWMVILINPSLGNLSITEQEALVNYVNSSNGFLVVLADSSSRSVNTGVLNNITEPFGITIHDADLIDNANNVTVNGVTAINFNNWANNSLAASLSNSNSYTITAYGTGLSLNTNISGTIPLLLGNNETRLYNGTIISNPSGTDIVELAISETNSGGLLFVSGGALTFSDALIEQSNNKDFILGLIEYALKRDLEISSYSAPTKIKKGKQIIISATIKNNRADAITNVSVGLEFDGPVILANASNIVNLSLGAGENKTLVFVLNTTGLGTVTFEIKTWSVGYVGYQVRGTITVYTDIAVSIWFEPDYIVLDRYNNSVLYINITNPAGNINISSIQIKLYPDTGLQFENKDFSIDLLVGGQSKIIEAPLEASETGTKGVAIQITYGSYLKNFKAYVHVYTSSFVVLDLGHGQDAVGYTESLFENLIKLFGDCYVNYGTINNNLLGNASMIIIVNPQNLTASEITALTNFINNGGTVVVTGDHYTKFDPTVVNSLTSNFGITYHDAIIMDDELNNGTSDAPIFKISNYPLFADVKALVMPNTSYMTLSGDAKAIVVGNPSSYGYGASGRTGVEGSDLVAMAVYENDVGGKLLAIGSTQLFVTGFKNASRFLDNLGIWGRQPDEEAPSIAYTLGYLRDENLNVVGINISISVTDNLAVKTLEVTAGDKVLYSNSTVLSRSMSVLIVFKEPGSWDIKIYAEDYYGHSTTKTIGVYIGSWPSMELPCMSIWVIVATIVVIGLAIGVYILHKKKLLDVIIEKIFPTFRK